MEKFIRSPQRLADTGQGVFFLCGKFLPELPEAAGHAHSKRISFLSNRYVTIARQARTAEFGLSTGCTRLWRQSSFSCFAAASLTPRPVPQGHSRIARRFKRRVSRRAFPKFRRDG